MSQRGHPCNRHPRGYTKIEIPQHLQLEFLQHFLIKEKQQHLVVHYCSRAIMDLHMNMVSPGLVFDLHQKLRDGWRIWL